MCSEGNGSSWTSALSFVSFVFTFWVWLQMLKEGPDQDIFIDSFLSLGRVDHLTMVMALHPSYLSCFLKAQHALLELDGPLPRHWRHYIALMVGGLRSCDSAFQTRSPAACH